MSSFLEARNIRKQFTGVLALDAVSLRLDRGEVLALVGENGAGKSTLMKVLAGIYQPDEGTLLLDGRTVHFRGVADAMAAGICLIHQELNLAENLSAAANIFLGREKTMLGWLKCAAMNATAARLLERVGLSPKLATEDVERLAPGQKQLVEIARALAMESRVIIMDEPTSSLTQGETERLYEVIDDLKRSGVAVVYISHRLAEVKRVADRVTVLRDGRNAGDLPREEINHDNLIRRMVGRDLKQLYPRTRSATPGADRLLVQGLRYKNGPAAGASFCLRAGEVVGMAGLVGAGRTELAEGVFGIRTVVAGSLRVDGVEITLRSQRGCHTCRSPAGPGGPPSARANLGGGCRLQFEPAELAQAKHDGHHLDWPRTKTERGIGGEIAGEDAVAAATC